MTLKVINWIEDVDVNVLMMMIWLVLMKKKMMVKLFEKDIAKEASLHLDKCNCNEHQRFWVNLLSSGDRPAALKKSYEYITIMLSVWANVPLIVLAFRFPPEWSIYFISFRFLYLKRINSILLPACRSIYAIDTCNNKERNEAYNKLDTE